jgi:hypothetical protein
MLHLVSRISKDKPNPSKERTTGLNIARAQKNDFLIPLNVDGLKPDELHWMTSDITFIPFHKNWADGYRRLLKKLDQIGTPRPLETNGPRIVADLMNSRRKIAQKDEVVLTNRLKFTQIPKTILLTTLIRELRPKELAHLSNIWPFYRIDNKTFLSFETPAEELLDVVSKTTQIDYFDVETIHNVPTKNIMKYLLENTIQVKFIRLGMRVSKIGKRHKHFFPINFLKKDKLSFVGYTGRKTYVKMIGSRIRYSGVNRVQYRYYISPRFMVKNTPNGEYILLIGTQLIITDLLDSVLSPRAALASRKHLCGGWWNDYWLQRNLAFASFLAEGKNEIVIGNNDAEKIILDSSFIRCISPLTILEDEETTKTKVELREELFQINNEETVEE